MRRALLLAALCAASACADEGRLSLRFRLSEALVRPPDPWLHVAVRGPDGRVLAGSVARLGEPIELDVAHGEGRVAVAELRDGPDAATAAVLGYGQSAPFALNPGDARTVEVEAEVAPVATIEVLTIPEARGAFVRDPAVTLEIVTSRPDIARVTVAQDPGLTVGRVDVDVEDGAPLRVPYDLDAACRAGPGCADGPRTVFVRVQDRAGYPSEPRVRALELDTRAPRIVPGTAGVRLDAPGGFVEAAQADEGFVVRVSFALTESVTATPTVELAGSGLPFAFEARSVDSWVFARTVTAQDPDGAQSPIVTAEDRAGNREPVPLGVEYQVSRDLPGPPAVDVPGRIVYRRAPWGDADEPRPFFEVVGEAGAVAPFTFVQVYDAPDVFEDEVVVAVRAGQAQADADGAFRVRLDPVDRADVYLLVVSGTGSLSARVATRVRDIEWVAPATASGSRPPPVTAALATTLDDSLDLDRAGVTVGLPPTALGAADAQTVVAQAPLRWQEILPVSSGRPAERRFAGAAYDWVRARGVLFGGRSSGDLVQQDVWELDDRAWRRVPAGPVTPRCDDGTAFGDDPFGYTTFVGGLARTVVVCRRLDPLGAPPLPEGSVDEMVGYGWDGFSWTELVLPDAPSGRVGHAVAYDPSRGRLVMFGGNTGTLQVPGPDVPGFRETLDETWEAEVILPSALAGAETSTAAQPGLRFVRRRPAASPPPRDRAAMVYDPARAQIVLFGGIGRDRQALDDLWTWDGETWRQVPRSGNWPPARAGHALVFDPTSGRVGLLGGMDREPRARQLRLQDPGLEDAWWWDGAAWSEGAAPPAGLGGGGLVAVPRRREAPLTLSPAPLEDDASVVGSEIWEVVPDGARLRTPSEDAPPARGELWAVASSARDTRRDALALVWSELENLQKDEQTWSWSWAGWRRVSTIHPDPPMGGGALVYDPGRRAFAYWGNALWRDGVLIRETNPRFFERGTGGDWARITLDPTPRLAGNAARGLWTGFDPALGEIVFLERNGSRWRLWSYDGARWQLLDDSPGPAASDDAGRLYVLPDPSRRYVMGSDGRLFAYDGAWREVTDTLPAGRLLYDAGRDRLMAVVVQPGEVTLFELSDADVFEPVETTLAPAGASRTFATFPELHYDAPRRRFVGSAGSLAGLAPGAVVTLDTDAEARPAVLAVADLAAAGIPAAAVTRVGATVVAGAEGARGATRAAGGALLGYEPASGSWRAIGTFAAGLDPLARATLSVAGPEARALVVPDSGRVAFAVAPSGRRGAAGAVPEVRVDQLVLSVRYRR